jgi:hypothetical protein
MHPASADLVRDFRLGTQFAKSQPDQVPRAVIQLGHGCVDDHPRFPGVNVLSVWLEEKQILWDIAASIEEVR